jgi:hypothetical protein
MTANGIMSLEFFMFILFVGPSTGSGALVYYKLLSYKQSAVSYQLIKNVADG